MLCQYSCFHFPPHHYPLPTIPTPHPQPYRPLALSMCPLYMFLDDHSPYFPHYALLLPSGYCQFVFYFNVSGSVLFACLFC